MEEQQIIEHFFHEHPLRRLPNSDAWATDDHCYGCWRYLLPGEAVYGCCSDNCRFLHCLHEECAEMAREIRHPVHPSHSLTQQDLGEAAGECAVCEESSNGLGYICSRGCDFWIHLACTGGRGLAAAADEEQALNHPSHPQHELRILRRKTRSCQFQCDACGTTEKGNSYICSICEYWIHETCAALPATADFPHHPDHSLSLAFHLPYEYIKYEYTCDICRGALRLSNWVYHCQLCRYVVHINCATDKFPNSIDNEDIVVERIIHFPINDGEELIRALVVRERGETEIVVPHEDIQIISRKYQFHQHRHLLSLITLPSSSSSDNEDDDDDCGRSELRCDGCTTPIHKKKQKSSSSDYYYMSCDECKYFLHLACFNLPPHLPSIPLHSIKDHKLALRNSSKLTDWAYCYICNRHTNGLSYVCSECPFTVDIKCASLPNTIKHAAHPQHRHYLELVTENDELSICGACYTYADMFYRCDSCQFCVCCECIFLPAVNKHIFEKHLLPLTYDAYINHPSEFYCGSCEGPMNPKKWMYHCRDCDESFHPICFPTASGEYRNINFGRQQYYVNMTTPFHRPHHPLRFQLIIEKKRCDVCHRYAYDDPGFQCASCKFVICFYPCSRRHMDAFKAIG